MSPEERARYISEYRAKNPAYRERQRAISTALVRAHAVVARRHPEELLVALNEARAERGLPPVGVLPVGRPKKHDAGT